MLFTFKLHTIHRATKAISENDLSVGFSLAILFVVIAASLWLTSYLKKLTPDELFTEDKESLGTLAFYNRFFAGQSIPFFLVEDIRNIFYEYDILRRENASYVPAVCYVSYVDNVSKLHADDDFKSILSFDPQDYIKKSVKEKLAVKITSEEVDGIHTFRELSVKS